MERSFTNSNSHCSSKQSHLRHPVTSPPVPPPGERTLDFYKHPRTPLQQKTIPSAPQSAPSKCHTQQQLTSPEAARRSKESLEAIHVARTLKEGFARLRARIHPHQMPSGSPLVTSTRPLRTHSATTTTTLATRRQRLTRHSSFHPSMKHAFSCPQPPRTNSTRDHRYLAPAPRFVLSAGTEPPSPPRAVAAEVAETMILFKSQSSSSIAVDLSDSRHSSSPLVAARTIDSTNPAPPAISAITIYSDNLDGYDTEEESIQSPSKRQRTMPFSISNLYTENTTLQSEQPAPGSSSGYNH